MDDNLYRSEDNRVIAGVAGGLGEYFDIDPTIIRVIFVLLTLFGFSGILIYLILWFIMPTKASAKPLHIHNKEELKSKIHAFAADVRGTTGSNSRLWIGFILIVLGLIFFASTLNIFAGFDLGKLWPLILILLGISLLGRK